MFSGMRSLPRKPVRSSWLYVTVVVLVCLFVCQIIPHDHSGAESADHRSEHHEAPVPHSHHSHSHDDDTGGESNTPWSAHHHDLTQHVDPHFLRTLSQDHDIDNDSALRIAELHPVIESDPVRTRWSDVDAWVPETIPILPLDSRAPPARG
jgi:hypothetical protein